MFDQGSLNPTKPVAVSPSLASKYSQQSIRQDLNYFVQPTQKENKSIYNKDSQSSTSQKVSYFQPIKSRYEAAKTKAQRFNETPVLMVLPKSFSIAENFVDNTKSGLKYLFVNPVKTTDYNNFYSDIPRERAKADESLKGASASKELFIIGATGFTARSVGLGTARANLVSRNAVQTVSSESGVTLGSSASKGTGLVERRILGIKVGKSKQFSFTGKSEGVAEPTGYYGGVSKEPIFKTKSQSSFDLSVGKKNYQVEASSFGGQVGEIGNQKVTATLSLKGGKSLKTQNYVDVNIVKRNNDLYFGGSLSKRNAEVIGGRQVLAYDDTIQTGGLNAKYVDPITNLDYSGGGSFANKNLVVTGNVKNVPVNVQIYDSGSAAATGINTRNLPGGLSFARQDVTSRLREESASSFKNDFIPTVYQKPVGGSRSTLSNLYSQDSQFNNLIKTNVEQISQLKTKPLLPSPINAPQQVLQSKKTQTNNTTKVSLDVISKQSAIPILTVSSLSKQKNNTIQNNKTSPSLKQNIQPALAVRSINKSLTSPISITEVTPKSLTRTSQVQTATLANQFKNPTPLRFASPPTPPPLALTPVVAIPTLRLNASGLSGRNDFGQGKTIKYIPTLASVYFKETSGKSNNKNPNILVGGFKKLFKKVGGRFF